MRPIHERMPVIIPERDYLKWLDKSADENDAYGLLDNCEYAGIVASAVSDYVNNPRHNDEGCLQ